MSFLKSIVVVFSVIYCLSAWAVNDRELLPPDVAFQATASMPNAQQVAIGWKIAKGYSLYRKNMRFESKSPEVSLGEATFPLGKIKHDELLGDIEHFRDELNINLPVTITEGIADFSLKIRYQGCADIGVCYPPQTKVLDIKLPAKPFIGSNSSPVDGLVNGFSNLKSNLFQDELLPPDQAFKFFVTLKNPNTLHTRWQIAKGYYQYREKTVLRLTKGTGIKLGAFSLPHGKPKEDEAFGRVEIFYGELAVDVPLIRSDSQAQKIVLEAKYQGCADRGVCYPPMTKQVEIEIPPLIQAIPPVAPAESAPLSEQDQITQSLSKDSLWVTWVSFFGFGILLAFTPCIFPMIPILSGIIVGKGNAMNTTRAFLLSLSYVVAGAMTYTVFGVLAALFGSNLQAAFQQPWIISLFSAIFVLLSLSMFGFYHLDLPEFIRIKLHKSTEQHQDGSLFGAAIMGALSSLIVGPCVAAPLAGALIYIGQTGDVWLGGSALFMMGLGMGVPLLLLGASAGKLLPKAGNWLNATKSVFGVVMLGVAIWMLSRIIPPSVTMLLWAVLLIIPAIYLRAVDPLPEYTSGWQKLWKGVGLTLLVYGLLLLIGFSMGNTNPLKPLQGMGIANAKAKDEGIPFKKIHSLAELDIQIAQAQAENKRVMLDFYADWCISCKEMEAYTFTDPAVKQALADFVLLQADVTNNSDEEKALLAKFNLIGPPAILFFKDSHQDNQSQRVIGFQDAKTFIATLQKITS